MADPLYRTQPGFQGRDPFAESDRPQPGTGGAQGVAGSGMSISEADLQKLIQMLQQMGPPQTGAAMGGVAGPVPEMQNTPTTGQPYPYGFYGKR